ncbi:hypothetical protein TWF481_009181 [Arthrobotrys musiformis]|uniref:Uncharacterized protein n=1 Tax=Arthrobotrys musiformis TaxID=47236 RepID=A0AAV9W499_9PEZI
MGVSIGEEPKGQLHHTPVPVQPQSPHKIQNPSGNPEKNPEKNHNPSPSPNPSDCPIISTVKKDPKTKETTLQILTASAPKQEELCMDLMGYSIPDRHSSPSPTSAPSPNTPVENMKVTISIPNGTGLKNRNGNKNIKPCPKDTLHNQRIFSDFLRQHANCSASNLFDPVGMFDKLVGSLDPNHLSDNDLDMVKLLTKKGRDDSSINTSKENLAGIIKGYVLKMYLGDGFPENIAKILFDFTIEELVETFFQDDAFEFH